MKKVKIGITALVAIIGVGGAFATTPKLTFGPSLYAASESIHPATSIPIYILNQHIPYELNPIDYYCNADDTVCTITLYAGTTIRTLADGRKFVYKVEAAIVDDEGDYVKQAF